LAVIRRMVSDMNIPVKIIGHPIVREADGLAMSSRNTNLDPANRAAALSLSSALRMARERANRGQTAVAELNWPLKPIFCLFPGPQSIMSVSSTVTRWNRSTTVDERTVLALAVQIDGKVRLIDNGYVMPGKVE
jgi:pantoate--beta-alanine ligase